MLVTEMFFKMMTNANSIDMVFISNDYAHSREFAFMIMQQFLRNNQLIFIHIKGF